MSQVSQHVRVFDDAIPQLDRGLLLMSHLLQHGAVDVLGIKVDFGAVVLELVHGVAFGHACEVGVVLPVELFGQVCLVKLF